MGFLAEMQRDLSQAHTPREPLPPAGLVPTLTSVTGDEVALRSQASPGGCPLNIPSGLSRGICL